MSEVTNKDIKVFKYIQAKPSLANDQNALIAEIWESEDFWKHTDLLTALRSVTSADSIKRSHRALRENGWIEVDKQLLKKNMKLMNKVRDERSPANIHAIKKNIEKPFQLREHRIVNENPVLIEFPPKVQTSLLGDNNV